MRVFKGEIINNIKIVKLNDDDVKNSIKTPIGKNIFAYIFNNALLIKIKRGEYLSLPVEILNVRKFNTTLSHDFNNDYGIKFKISDMGDYIEIKKSNIKNNNNILDKYFIFRQYALKTIQTEERRKQAKEQINSVMKPQKKEWSGNISKLVSNYAINGRGGKKSKKKSKKDKRIGKHECGSHTHKTKKALNKCNKK